MPDEMKVQVEMFKDAKDFNWGGYGNEPTAVQYQVRIAKIEMEFPEFDASLVQNTKLREELQGLFQELANQSFGLENVTVEVELAAGSLIIVALLVVGGGGYKFFKNYEQLRNGVVKFAEDVKAATKKVENIIRKAR